MKEQTELTIEMNINVKASVGEVWNALTDRDELENWWSEEVVLEPRVGGKFQENWEDDDGQKQIASGKVLSVQDQKLISFTWREKNWPKTAQTECVFEITPDGKKSTLTMQHKGWETLPEPLRTTSLRDFKVGWSYHMKELKAYLDE